MAKTEHVQLNLALAGYGERDEIIELPAAEAHQLAEAGHATPVQYDDDGQAHLEPSAPPSTEPASEPTEPPTYPATADEQLGLAPHTGDASRIDSGEGHELSGEQQATAAEQAEKAPPKKAAAKKAAATKR
jgi:hypothetical protein